jgi:hypothetical protein
MNPTTPHGTGPHGATTPARVPEIKAEGQENATLATITVASRVPDFWADQPRLWFVQFEAVVESQRLTEAAKQNLVVAKLNKTAIQQVSDLLLAPPAERKYQTLKERLLQVFEESETRQFQKLLGEMELGSQKPSQLLRRMKDLARGKIPDATLQIMWNSHLPPGVQAVLAVTQETDLANLANVADKVLEATRPVDIAEVATSKSEEKAQGSIPTEIASIVARLSIEVAELRRSRDTQRKNPDRGRSSSGNRRFERPRSSSRNQRGPNWLCFYHYRFRERAAKCVQPCSWKKPKAQQPAEN